jgi:hypothetical protein
MSQEQNPQIPTDTAPDDVGSLDAAARAFELRETAPEETEAEPEATEPADTDADAEGDEPDTEEAPEVEPVEVVVEGVTLSLTPEQAEAIQKSTLRQADYSRKMNEVSAKEKAVVQTLELAEKMRTGAEKFAQVLATVQGMDSQIKQYEALDWPKLRAEDPAQYAAYAADLQTLKLNKQQAELMARGVVQEVEESSHKVLQAKREEMFTALGKQLPGWSNQMGEQITQYAVSLGMQFETLSKATDPALVIALEKARKFDALQKSAGELKAKAKTAPPVLKPGVRTAKQTPQEESMTQLRKFKTRDAAEVAFLARMK